MAMDWTALELRLADRCGSVRCEPRWQLAPHFSRQLRDCDLWFVWAGRGRMQLTDEAVDRRPGVLIWMRPDRSYFAQHDADDRLGVTFIHFELRDDTGQPLRHDRLPPEVHDVRDLALFDAGTRRILDLMSNVHPDHPGRAAAAHHLMRGLLIDLDLGSHRPESVDTPGGTSRLHHDMVRQLTARIREDPTHVPSIAEVARQAGYSSDHFSRVFKRITGQSPQSYVVEARIDRARRLLIETGLTVSEIAHALGYRDVYFFSRQFKAKTRVSPTAYRRRSIP